MNEKSVHVENINGKVIPLESLDDQLPDSESFRKMYKQHNAEGMPFHFIPSCSSFRVEESVADTLFQLFGLKKKVESPVKIRN